MKKGRKKLTRKDLQLTKCIHTHVLAFRIDVKRVHVATEDTSKSLKSVKST